MWNVRNRCGLAAPRTGRSPPSSLCRKIFPTQTVSGLPPPLWKKWGQCYLNVEEVAEARGVKETKILGGGGESSFSSCETQTHRVDELNSNMSSEIMLTQLKLICMVLSWIHSFIEEKQVSCLLYIRLCQKWGLQLWERQSWLPKANKSKGRPALHNFLGSHPVLEHSCLPVLKHTSLVAATKPWDLFALLVKHLP